MQSKDNIDFTEVGSCYTIVIIEIISVGPNALDIHMTNGLQGSSMMFEAQITSDNSPLEYPAEASP